MAKVQLGALLTGIRGAIGGVVFKRHGKETIITMLPTRTVPWSELQEENRGRFAAAAAYGKRAMATPELKAVYRALHKKTGKPTNCLAIRDYYNPPEVEEIDPSGYTGEAGSVIRVEASDDTGILSLEVVIRDEAGNVLERGLAADVARGVRWDYRATSSVAEGTSVLIKARATDRPGGTGHMEIAAVVSRASSRSRAPLPRRTLSPFARRLHEERGDVRRYGRIRPDGLERRSRMAVLLE